jgi:hypothetical protein
MRAIVTIGLFLVLAATALAQTFLPSDSPDTTVTVQGAGGQVTISAPFSRYQGNTAFWAFENPWATVTGSFGDPITPSPVPYSESITVNPDTFPDGTVINFSWPDTFKGAYSYPEVVWGSQFGGYHPSPNGVTPTPVQVNAIHTFTGTFDLSLTSNPDNYDVLWETYLTTGPNNGLPAIGPNTCEPNGVPTDRCLVLELGIILHAYPGYVNFLLGFPHYLYTSPDGSFSAHIIDLGPGPPTNNHASIIVLPVIVANGGDLLSGTIDLLALLKNIQANGFGFITGNEYVDGWEMGIETTKGAGSFTINHLSYTLN